MSWHFALSRKEDRSLLCTRDLAKKPAGREQQERTRAPLLHDCHNSERFPAAPADGRGTRRQHGHQHDGAGDAFPRVLFFTARRISLWALVRRIGGSGFRCA